MFDDNCAIQVLAALRRNVDAERLEYGLQAFKNCLADFGHGVAPDIVPERRTRAAADNHDIARRKARLFHKFHCGVFRVALNLFDKIFVVNFVSNASHKRKDSKK
jgi:hypothetical protein